MATLEIRIAGEIAVYRFDDFAKIDFGLERELQKQVTVLLTALYKLQEEKANDRTGIRKA